MIVKQMILWKSAIKYWKSRNKRKGDMDIRVGCCGFSKNEEEYFTKFKTVEIQETYAEMPEEETFEKWRHAAPDDFEFTVRANKIITRTFKPTDKVLEVWEKIDRAAAILKTKTILFQSPDVFFANKKNEQNIKEFFDTVDRKEYMFAWKPGKTWKEEEIRKVCERSDLVHCVDPFVCGQLYGDRGYFRLDSEEVSRFKGMELKKLRDFCEKESRKKNNKPIYVFFDNVYMTTDAQRFEWMAFNTGPIKDLTLSFLKGLCREIECAEEDEKVQTLSREAERIVTLILHTDYARVDIEIEKGKLREMCKELFPDKEDLYDMIYGNRFDRLWEQFREEKIG